MMVETRILQAVTPLHVGEGHAIGAIDLPVTRERHARWPFIPGAGLKGGVRAWNAWRGRAGSAELVDAFGPAEADGALSAGDLCFGAATLLALPVRSLRGGFVLLTCPLAMARLARLHPDAPLVPAPGPDRALVAADHPCVIPHHGVDLDADAIGLVVLEELCWVARRHEAPAQWAAWLSGWLGEEAPLERLAVVHDDVFSHAVTAWTEARTRAAIDPETEVVADGKLFSVEMLPQESLLWTTLSARRGSLHPHAALLPRDGELFHLGGQRSVGLGRVAWYSREDT
ncbi:MAG: type III-B CRISPR module RAMP protein Cmr4 [Alphaproteobacteria bacterium]|nr:type III-B CRISPR module RAMP protein Cmr4 [Alphaproteobacteria bacterium]